MAAIGPKPQPLLLVVAAALVTGGRVLMAQRPAGKPLAGLWEFPGGKVMPGETPEAALIRELEEELGVRVAAADLQPLTFASHAADGFHLLMPLFLCRHWQGEPQPLAAEALVWADAAILTSLPLPPADLPLLPALWPLVSLDACDSKGWQKPDR